MPIVKISFSCNNRSYEIGIKNFLEIAGVSMTDAEITRAVNQVLNTVGATNKEK